MPPNLLLLTSDLPSLGSYLSGAGYATALIGKAHFQQLHNDERFPWVESYPLWRDLEYWRSHPGSWYGFDHVELARDHALVENRHQPRTIHLKTLVEQRYQLTVYDNRDGGELFDLESDPA